MCAKSYGNIRNEWRIPGHYNIEGNEKADELACEESLSDHKRSVCIAKHKTKFYSAFSAERRLVTIGAVVL